MAILKIKNKDTGQWQDIPALKGEPFKYEDFTPEQLEALKGANGESGVYVGSEEPVDDSNVWIDPNGTEDDIDVEQLINEIIDRLDGYAKIEDIPTSLDQLASSENYRTVTDAEKSNWNNKADGDHNHAEYLTEESDPTVPDWAKQSTKPTYNANEVGADASGTAVQKVYEHNVATDVHNDIRLLIKGLDDRLTALANSDDTTLDQLSEIVSYIKANRNLIESVTTTKVNVEDIINNLTTNVTNKPLSAAQGVALKGLIDTLSNTKVDSAAVATAIENALKSYPTTTTMQNTINASLTDYAKTSAIPTKLSQLTEDTTHRIVTDAEKTVWNNKAAGDHNHDSSYILKSEVDLVPSYVVTEATEVSTKVTSVRDAYSFVFGAISDLHYDAQSSDSILHAGMGMNEINKRTRLDAVLNFGDIMYGSLDASNIEGFPYVRCCLSDVMKAVPYIQMQGNHDEYDTAYTEAEEKQRYFSHIGSNNTGTVTDWANRFRNYGYRDFEDEKIRVIYLNSVDLSTVELADLPTNIYGTNNKCYISGVQLKWLVEKALDFSSKSDADNWGFIVCCHHPLNWSGVQMGKLLSVLKAYRNKSSGSVSEDDITVSFNFINAKATLVAHFHGHNHNFRAETIEGVLTITIPNACFGRNNEYGKKDTQKEKWGDADASGAQRFFDKTRNTENDTAFNVVVIDRTNEVIHCFNYGAGIDRVIPYGAEPKIYRSITNTLTNVSTSNSAISVEDGASYHAKLVANDGYTLTGATVTITMGGTNITSSAYSNGVINIASVTGDVVIVATAVSTKPSYTNLIDEVGYTDGVRLSTSTGEVKNDAPDHFATGFIPLTDKTSAYRTKGIDFRYNNSTNKSACVVYQADKTTKSTSFNITDSHAHVTLDDEGNIVSLSLGNSTVVGGYLRLCAKGSGANLIVTKNEEIV